MSRSRVKNSARNMVTGTLYQILILGLNFVSRTIFIHLLGVEYLGINGLFSNILTVLSLAELGIGSAVIYGMYKPLAQQDTAKLTALVNYYKKLYNLIAVIVAALGLALIPFLGYLVNLNEPIEHLTAYYLLFLANSVMSYLFVYRTSIAIADQKSYKLKPYYMLVAVLQFALQIAVLLLTHNYMLYVAVQVCCSLLVNILSARKTTKMYPYIKGKEELSKGEKSEILRNVKSFFFYKLGGVVLNNTDNILISIILGTVWVGYFSNYSLVITQIVAFTNIIFVSVQASVGNLNTEENIQKQYFVFKTLNLLSYWIYGFCCVCFCVLFQDFITLWLGKDFLISQTAVYMIVTTFYLQGILWPLWCYRQTTGLFRHTKYVMFFAAVINLVLSIWWGYAFGLVGILAATVVARLATNIWFEPFKLHTLFFHRSPKKYYLGQLGNAALLVGLIVLTAGIASHICLPDGLWTLVIKFVLCFAIVNGAFFLLFRKTEEFKYLYNISLKKLAHKIKRI